MARRNTNGRSSISRKPTEDGRWHGWVSMGKDPLTGEPIRRHVAAKTKAEVTAKVAAMERDRDNQQVISGKLSATVESWLYIFLGTKEEVAASTFGRLEWAVRYWLIPTMGGVSLKSLTPELIDDRMKHLVSRAGTSATLSTRTEVHRVLKEAVTLAYDRGHLSRNPMNAVKLRKADEKKIEPLSREEVQALLKECTKRRNSARWFTSLALGLRQGEVLGLRWSDIDFETGAVAIRGQYLRRLYSHGCGKLSACGKMAAQCPRRIAVSRVGDAKSKSGHREHFAPEGLLAMLREHRAAQNSLRLRVGDCWHDEDWVFCTREGRPLDHRNDYRSFKTILKASCVKPARLHDLRHTYATALLVEGVDPRVVQELMGWSASAMAAMSSRYQHVVESLKRDASEKIGRDLFGTG